MQEEFDAEDVLATGETDALWEWLWVALIRASSSAGSAVVLGANSSPWSDSKSVLLLKHKRARFCL